jgi:two-component system sensor histidine kinase UhpB
VVRDRIAEGGVTPVSLFWRIFLLNAVVLGAATALLLWAPVTVSVPVLLTEAVILVGGLAVMLVANAALLRWGLAPLDRLTRRMTTVDLLRPGQRLPEHGSGEVADVIRTFNAMLDRLEHERVASSARVLFAQEAERRRIAQELHDEVGQSMTAILLALKRAADTAQPPLRDELRQIQEITRDSLDEVRRLLRRLRPGVLEDLGLVSALTALAGDFATHTGLVVRRDFDGDLPPLEPGTELVVYRVAQESLTNAARHADAENVTVRLRRARAAVELSVTDDGRGVGRLGEGAGIRGMRERALLAGGSLRIGPGPSDRGTTVRLTVPVPSATAPAAHGATVFPAPPGLPAVLRTPREGTSPAGAPPAEAPQAGAPPAGSAAVPPEPQPSDAARPDAQDT